jgi:hypothetical protein
MMYSIPIFIILGLASASASMQQTCTVRLYDNKCDDDLNVAYCGVGCFNNYNTSMTYACYNTSSHDYATVTIFQEPNCTGSNQTYIVPFEGSSSNASDCVKIAGQNWNAAPWSDYCNFPPHLSSSSLSWLVPWMIIGSIIIVIVMVSIGIYVCRRWRQRQRRRYVWIPT